MRRHQISTQSDPQRATRMKRPAAPVSAARLDPMNWRPHPLYRSSVVRCYHLRSPAPPQALARTHTHKGPLHGGRLHDGGGGHTQSNQPSRNHLDASWLRFQSILIFYKPRFAHGFGSPPSSPQLHPAAVREPLIRSRCTRTPIPRWQCRPETRRRGACPRRAAPTCTWLSRRAASRW